MALFKRWVFPEKGSLTATEIAKTFGSGPLLSGALAAGGFSSFNEIETFIEAGFPIDPFLLKDMNRAVQRITEAVENFEKIAVFGDYDADGVTATAILCSFLEAIGADVTPVIPKRLTDGYGLSSNAVKQMADDGVKLIVTVDNGISAAEAVETAAGLGIDVVVTDHHLPPETLPSALAVVNPQRSDNKDYKELSGAGVALLLAAALSGGDEDALRSTLEQYADVCAVGLIGDAAPMTGITRRIVLEGLRSVNHGTHPGIAALLRRAGAETGSTVTAETLAYSVIPKINAAGRLGDSENALRLLLCEDEESAAVLAAKLTAENEKRRELEKQITAEAENMVLSGRMENDCALVLWSENWHQGVLGIAAARLSEKFCCPCALLSVNDGIAKGSARAPSGFNLFGAVSQCSGVLTRFGGHTAAAGIEAREEDLPSLKKLLCDHFSKNRPSSQAQKFFVTARARLGDITVGTVKELDLLAPFGSGNPQPTFLLENVTIDEVVSIGGGGHTRIKLSDGADFISAVIFRQAAADFPFSPGSRVDVAAFLSTSIWNGKERAEVRVCALRPAEMTGQEDEYFRGFEMMKKLSERTPLTEEEKTLVRPCREDFALVWKELQRKGCMKVHKEMLPFAFKGIGAARLHCIFSAMQELLLASTEQSGEFFKISPLPTSEKVDLQKASIFESL